MPSEPEKPDSGPIKVAFCIECDCVKFSEDKLAEMLRQTCLRFGTVAAQINIAIVDNSGICEIHSQFLNSSKITDVISFDLSDDSRERLFDIVINAQLAEEKAGQRQVSPEAELALYALHGLLHNLGFDDIALSDAEKMHRTEDEILQEFGYGIVYSQE
ncbi:MAG: rRNA maturation RNase YbeY [Anaerohalosphaeraceae bacterium]|nr:rRNA maturation RNase YbeY [Anaerohalosphaeraceae bacterium]